MKKSPENQKPITTYLRRSAQEDKTLRGETEDIRVFVSSQIIEQQ